MRKQNHPIRLLHSTRAFLLPWLLWPAVHSSAQAPQLLVPSTDHTLQPAQPTPIRIENVVHLVGLEDKSGGTGYLAFDENDMTLHVHDRSTSIPLRSILAFSIALDDKPLISGTKGKLAEMAPYGIGMAVTLTRPSAETLTLFYRDSNRAVHGCVLILPKEAKERVLSTLASAELTPGNYPKAGNLIASPPQPDPAAQMASAPGSAKPSIEVTLPSESIDDIPSAFPSTLFEDLIEQLTQSNLFAHVWRAGDRRRTPDTLVLHADIQSWNKGSARKRGLVPFTGATAIKAGVTLTDASGRTVFQREVNGTKRMKGEGLEVTKDLAKNIRKELEKTPDLPSNKQKDK